MRDTLITNMNKLSCIYANEILGEDMDDMLLYDVLEEIREELCEVLDTDDELFYMPNDHNTLITMMIDDDLNMIDVMRWALADGYNPEDSYIKYSSFSTITADDLAELYLDNYDRITLL